MGSGERLFEVILAGIAIFLLLFFQLGSLVPGLSPGEVLTRQSSYSLENIFMSPLFAPYKLLQFCVIKLGFDSAFGIRAVSAVVGVMIIFTVFYVLRRWYTVRVSTIGTLLFACSSWLLVYARQATPDICYGLIIVLLAYGTWVRRTKRAGLALFLGALLCGLLMYIPGLVWVLILGMLWQGKEIIKLAKEAPRLSVLNGLLFVLIITPLVVACINDTSLIRLFVGLNPLVRLTPSGFFHNIGGQLNAIFWQGPKVASQGLVGSALLDPFVLVMGLLGVYAFVYQRALDRTRMIGGGLVIGLVLIGLGGLVNSLILMPLIYIVAVAGATLLIQQWFTVFPRNPLARALGIIVVSAAVLLTSYYQLDRYFEAWSGSRATKQLFSLKIDA